MTMKFLVARRIAEQHPAFAGHFPGAPLLPGVVLLSEVLEAILDEPALRERVGDCPALQAAKFLAPVRPGTTLRIELRAEPGAVSFEVCEHERSVARGRYGAAAATR